MVQFAFAVVSALALLPWSALAARRFHGNVAPLPATPKIEPPSHLTPVSRNGTTLPPYDTWYYFNQLIDHSKLDALSSECCFDRA